MRLHLPALLVACLLAGCAPIPRDPDRTLERVRGGVLLAGASHDPPHVRLGGATGPQGDDVERVNALARTLGARVRWVEGDHEGLLGALHARHLHLVVGGVDADSPWAQQVGLTRPYPALDDEGRTVQRVMAVPPGENAWLMQVEAVVHPERG